MNLSSHTPTTSSSSKSPIASKGPGIVTATVKPESGMRGNAESDAASSFQARLKNACIGGLMDKATEKLVATTEESGEDGISVLHLLDLVIEIFHSLPHQMNKPKTQESQGNWSRSTTLHSSTSIWTSVMLNTLSLTWMLLLFFACNILSARRTAQTWGFLSAVFSSLCHAQNSICMCQYVFGGKWSRY